MKKLPLTLTIVQGKDEILLGMKKRGFGAGRWNGFGGKLEEGESLEDAAKRELKEESNLEAQDLKKIGVIEFEFKGKEKLLEVHIFKVRKFLGEPKESEEMRPHWFNIKQIPFESMWSDDIYWMDLFLKDIKFTAKFLFDENDKVIDYSLNKL